MTDTLEKRLRELFERQCATPDADPSSARTHEIAEFRLAAIIHAAARIGAELERERLEALGKTGPGMPEWERFHPNCADNLETDYEYRRGFDAGASRERGRIAELIDKCADECIEPTTVRVVRTIAGCVRDALAESYKLLPAVRARGGK